MDQKNEVSSRPREEPEKQVDGCTRIGVRDFSARAEYY